jgi:hypothetical protein
MASFGVFYNIFGENPRKENTMNKKAIIAQLEVMAEAMEMIESLLAEDNEEPKKNQWGRKAIKVLGKDAAEKSNSKVDTSKNARENFWKTYDHELLQEGDGIEVKKYLYHMDKFNKNENKYSRDKIETFLANFRSGKDDIEKRTSWLVRENKKAKAS